MRGVLWSKKEWDFLTENFEELSNRELAVQLTLLEGNVRTPNAIAFKLTYLKLYRTYEQRRATRNSRSICECCGSKRVFTESCFNCAISHYELWIQFVSTYHNLAARLTTDKVTKFTQLDLCMTHEKFLWEQKRRKNDPKH